MMLPENTTGFADTPLYVFISTAQGLLNTLQERMDWLLRQAQEQDHQIKYLERTHMDSSEINARFNGIEQRLAHLQQEINNDRQKDSVALAQIQADLRQQKASLDNTNKLLITITLGGVGTIAYALFQAIWELIAK